MFGAAGHRKFWPGIVAWTKVVCGEPRSFMRRGIITRRLYQCDRQARQEYRAQYHWHIRHSVPGPATVATLLPWHRVFKNVTYVIFYNLKKT